MGDRIAKKVLLLGWDAADWKIINPLLEKGWMPNLQKLMDNGVSGNLATIRPILSPMLWNSIATGKRADKHGICGFREPTPDGTGIRPVTSTSRKCKAIWNILTQNDMKSNVVGWFASDPAEPINGTVVTDHYNVLCKMTEDKRTVGPGMFHPAELADELMPLIVDPSLITPDALTPFVPEAARIDQKKDGRLLSLAMLISRMSTIQAAAHHVMTQHPWDFMAVYFDAIDQFGHCFMPYHPPQMEGISDEDALIYKDVINGAYRFQDLMLGATLSLIDDDTTVMIISDHGFHHDQKRPSTSGTQNPEGWHAPFGMACISGPGIKKNEKLYGATLLDITPTLLTMFGLPIGADMDGRPLLEIFEKPIRADQIMSWESVEGECGQHTEEMREDPVAAAEALKHLVELGYIEDPGQDINKAIRDATFDLKHNLANALGDSLRVNKSLPVWDELIEMFPDIKYFKVQKAKAYVKMGDHEQCDKIVREWLDEDELKVPQIQLLLGDNRMAAGEHGKALEYYQQAQADCPELPGVFLRLGLAFTKLSRWDEAEQALMQSLEVEGGEPSTFNGLAQVQIHRGQYAEAVENALRTVGMFHHFPEAHRNLGIALAEMGMSDQAIQAFETSLTMDPTHRQTHLWLARLYRRDDRDIERATRHEVIAGKTGGG